MEVPIEKHWPVTWARLGGVWGRRESWYIHFETPPLPYTGTALLNRKAEW